MSSPINRLDYCQYLLVSQINYRLYERDGDGKSKLDHVSEMLISLVHHKQLPFHAVGNGQLVCG